MMANLVSRGIRATHRLTIQTRLCLPLGRRPGRAVILMFHSVGGLAEAPYIVKSGVPSIAVNDFRELLKFFARRGFHSITVQQYVELREKNELPPRALVLTFDDGFRDNHAIAAPILSELGMTATFFPVAGWIGRDTPAWLHQAAWLMDRAPRAFVQSVGETAGPRWGQFFGLFNSTGRETADALLVLRQALPPGEQRAALERCRRLIGACASDDAKGGSTPSASSEWGEGRRTNRHQLSGEGRTGSTDDLQVAPEIGVDRDQQWDPWPRGRLYMNWAELKDLLRSGFEIGAHTVTHRSLWTLPPATASREIVDSGRFLERRLGCKIVSFAYPFGHYLPAHLNVLRSAGFKAALTTRGHSNGPSTPCLELGRHGVNDGMLNRYDLGRLALNAQVDPVARVNRWLGRHLDSSSMDVELGRVCCTQDGYRYNAAAGCIL